MIRSLTNDPNVATDRALGEMNVPLEPLARRLNDRFFDGDAVLAAEDFNDTTLLGTVVLIVRQKLGT